MSYCEKDFASDFSRWLRNERKQGRMKFTFAIEHKVCKKNRLNFNSDFQIQQLPSLEQTKHDCIYYKMSDLDVGRKPYDAWTMCFEKAFVAVMFYAPRKPKTFYMIDIDKIIEFNKINKSITEQECSELAECTFNL